MNKETEYALEECFRELPKPDKLRLRYHLEQGTHILCGKNSSVFTDGAGGG